MDLAEAEGLRMVVGSMRTLQGFSLSGISGRRGTWLRRGASSAVVARIDPVVTATVGSEVLEKVVVANVPGATEPASAATWVFDVDVVGACRRVVGLLAPPVWEGTGGGVLPTLRRAWTGYRDIS